VTANITQTAISSVQVDLFGYFGLDGEYVDAVASWGADGDAALAHLLPWLGPALAKRAAASIGPASPRRADSALFAWNDRIHVVALAPVLPSNCTGAPRGWVAFARTLGDEQLEDLRASAQFVSATLQPADIPESVFHAWQRAPYWRGPELVLPLAVSSANQSNAWSLRVISPQRVERSFENGDAALMAGLLGTAIPLGLAMWGVLFFWLRAAGRQRRLSEIHRAFLDQTHEGIVIVFEQSGAVKYFNPASAALLGAPDNVKTPREFTQWLANTPELTRLLAARNERREELTHTAGATTRTLEVLRERGSSENKEDLLYIRLLDKSEERAAEAKIRHMAFHDMLTMLPNRAQFMERWHNAVERARQMGEALAVIYVDIDHFKSINDRFGHEAGDQVLGEAARRIRHSVAQEDFVARLGGDEFVVVLASVPSALILESIAARIVSNMHKPMLLSSGETVQTGASLGVASFPSPVTDPGRLLESADQALYATKARGRNGYTLYDAQVAQAVVDARLVGTAMARGLANGEFEMFYQPIFRISSGEVAGVEALMRWRSPDLGLLGAAEFLAAARLVGLAEAVTSWALERACRDFGCWLREGLAVGRLTVNVSPDQLADSAFVDILCGALERHHISATLVDLDVPELEGHRHYAFCIQTLLSLEKLGISLHRDDFGEGVSSITQLQRLPWSRLKLDVRESLRDKGERENTDQLRSLVHLGMALGLGVAAEGVENAGALASLAALGFEYAQGFGLARPMDATSLGAYLREQAPMFGAPSA
jgi:diguanylate cyclase (GGDEF)-like protein